VRTLNLHLHGESWPYLAAMIELQVPGTLVEPRA
jgi:hypothetical protein